MARIGALESRGDQAAGGGAPHAVGAASDVPGDGSGTRTYTLVGTDGLPYESPVPGTLGGYRRGPRKLYGRLYCPSALQHLARGHYAKHRVFFLNEPTAIAAGYRPCAVCLPEQYAAWDASAAA